MVKKAVLKTTKNLASVKEYINSVPDDNRRADCIAIDKLMREVTGEEPAMWGPSIVGYGGYEYVSPKTGRTGDWFITGWSNRVASITLYMMSGFDQLDDLLPKLGKYKSSGSCLYIKNLNDVDKKVLKEVIKRANDNIRKNNKVL